jgi:hypothetical protein
VELDFLMSTEFEPGRPVAAQENSHASHQFRCAERLGDVIVSAEIEARKAFIFLCACGEHQERNVAFA